MSASKVNATALKDQRICVFGFGTAGLGIADGIRNALTIEEGLSSEEANKRFWSVGKLQRFLAPSYLLRNRGDRR